MEFIDTDFLKTLYTDMESVRFAPNTKWRAKGSVVGDFIVVSFGYDDKGFEKYEVISLQDYKLSLREYKIKQITNDFS